MPRWGWGTSGGLPQGIFYFVHQPLGFGTAYEIRKVVNGAVVSTHNTWDATREAITTPTADRVILYSYHYNTPWFDQDIQHSEDAGNSFALGIWLFNDSDIYVTGWSPNTQPQVFLRYDFSDPSIIWGSFIWVDVSKTLLHFDTYCSQDYGATWANLGTADGYVDDPDVSITAPRHDGSSAFIWQNTVGKIKTRVALVDKSGSFTWRGKSNFFNTGTVRYGDTDNFYLSDSVDIWQYTWSTDTLAKVNSSGGYIMSTRLGTLLCFSFVLGVGLSIERSTDGTTWTHTNYTCPLVLVAPTVNSLNTILIPTLDGRTVCSIDDGLSWQISEVFLPATYNPVDVSGV
jgi:predicted secreted protein